VHDRWGFNRSRPLTPRDLTFTTPRSTSRESCSRTRGQQCVHVSSMDQWCIAHPVSETFRRWRHWRGGGGEGGGGGSVPMRLQQERAHYPPTHTHPFAQSLVCTSIC
jgi:hypothetical protein